MHSTSRLRQISRIFVDIFKLTERCCKVIQMSIDSSPPQCRIYASVTWVSIDLDNGLSPIRRQTII